MGIFWIFRGDLIIFGVVASALGDYGHFFLAKEKKHDEFFQAKFLFNDKELIYWICFSYFIVEFFAYFVLLELLFKLCLGLLNVNL